MSKSINYRLVDGPIFGPRFVLWKWLAFQDRNGKDCFETHIRKQIINTIARVSPVDRNLAYAEIIQEGTWD